MAGTNSEMQKVVEYLENELSGIRTGRANPVIVHDIQVDAYGTATPLKQIAQISVPDATTIAISPWDPGLVPNITQAIKQSDIGIEPNSDSQTVRLTLPPMTEERRRELTKVVGERLEAARVSLRNIRHEAIAAKEKDDLPEDRLKHEKEELTKLSSEYNDTLEKLASEKKNEIMTI